MQKNKFVHEDIKAVCSSATKNLIACGLVVAVNGGNIVNAQTREFDAKKQLKNELHVAESTTVGSVSNTSNSQSRSSRQPRATAGSSENGTSRILSPEELKAVIAKGKGEYQTWLDWCKANRVFPVLEFLTLDNGGRFIVTPQAQDQPANNSPIVASESTTEVNASNNPGKIVTSNYSLEDFVKDGERLLALQQARVRDIEAQFAENIEEFERQKKQVAELEEQMRNETITIEQNEKVLAELQNTFNKAQTQVNKKLATTYAYYEYDPMKSSWNGEVNSDDIDKYCDLPDDIRTAALKAFSLRHKLDYLRDRIRDYNRRLEGGVISFVMNSLRYRQVECSLQPQSPEPDRYDIEQAPAYVEWATNEVNRLEPVARDMLQQLRIDGQELIDFENRVRWFTPGEKDFLSYMSEENSLEGFFTFAQSMDDNFKYLQTASIELTHIHEENDQLQIDINEQTERIRRNQEELSEMQQNLHRIVEENLAFFSQPDTPPTLTNNDNEATQNDNNLIHNNQIEEIQNDNNLIHNNQIEEIQEVTNEQDNNNLINNNQQQQPILHIAPLNVPAPQQRNGIVGGTIKFIGNAVSFFNPFSKK